MNCSISTRFVTRGLQKAVRQLSATTIEDNWGWKEQDGTFKLEDLIIEKAQPSQIQPKPDWNNLKFGHHFSDHMLEVDWTLEEGWQAPKICPLHNLEIHPAAKVLHYAIELFEGLKAYRGVDNRIRMFRPDMNMKRMIGTAERACLPTFDGRQLVECMRELIKLDQEWVPYSSSSSLYIRPTFIGTDPHLGVIRSNVGKLFVLIGPTGPYYSTGFKPISLYANSEFHRAWPGGVGAYKMGCNYAPTIKIGKLADELGCQQVLWLMGEEEYLTEVGTMNIFIFWKNDRGEKELITPPLKDGVILPGVTRQSLLDLAREWREFKVAEYYPSMTDIRKALREDRVRDFVDIEKIKQII